MTHPDLIDPGAKKKQPIAINEMPLNAKPARINEAFQCQTIISIPLPFVYFITLGTFLAIWFILFSLSIVESMGWISVLWKAIINDGSSGLIDGQKNCQIHLEMRYKIFHWSN